ncbi:cytidylate kinase-like family protein [Lacrimispora sp. 210928-DFI.3.58]|uniref:cytidylate kinase-like family protein n=1 Tax=Lacrimispora sp. 210928-DFI.3.58 TaxID=2883214 RepID=UPI001D090212|nr:cytidylate kinase-like family protein [Lacrimispora sp. 210928-DFI.3.58]MCB7317865.1 cytidylate kinase-like family protein [Lacrimispora sp. 210928-DFI.3.58]
MGYTEHDLRELAERIYDLDAEVYTQLGSSLGRVYNRDRERCVEEIVLLMKNRDQAHVLRSELALISNMARTIQDKELRKLVMSEYNRILTEVTNLPTSFGTDDIKDQTLAQLNALNLKERFSGDDHLIICISRAYGCGGSAIGFSLADSYKINYYDVEIFNAVLSRLEAEKSTVEDKAGFPYSRPKEKEGQPEYGYEPPAFAEPKKLTLREHLREFSRYHGLPKKDAIFFNQSDLICDMAAKEDFIVMGRCADVILTNNRIPHVSIYITAPFEQRVNRIMRMNSSMTEKQVRRLVRKMDQEHTRYYKFYTGRRWGNAVNYDLCINSASYGIDGAVELIRRMVDPVAKNEKLI